MVLICCMFIAFNEGGIILINNIISERIIKNIYIDILLNSVKIW